MRHHKDMQTPDLERRVLRNALTFFTAVTIAFWLVNGLSLAEEWRRDGEADTWVRALTLEGTSALAILIVMVPAALWERRAPVLLERWRLALPEHIMGSLLFSGVHIALMNIFRIGIWPMAFGAQYAPQDNLFDVLIYEYRKDVLSYALLLSTLAIIRGREDALQQAQAERTDAQIRHVITLRSGGREIRLPAQDIISASASGNYVEVTTDQHTYLARMTLTRLLTLLQEAEANPVRLHRSHLARRDAMREIVPSGDGDAQVRLSDGRILPASRSYRNKL